MSVDEIHHRVEILAKPRSHHYDFQSETSSEGSGGWRQPIWLGGRSTRQHFFQIVAMPQFKYQQAPDSPGMITASPKMFVQPLADPFRLKISPPPRPCIQQNGRNQVFPF